jgi:hypothetical protein
MLKEDLKHITINDLLDRKEISVQASNCCTTYKYHTLFDIVNLYERGKLLFTFRHFRKGVHIELRNLCIKYIEQIEQSNTTIIETKEDFKRITIKNLLNKQEISLRASNSCIKYKIHSLFDIIELYENGRLFFRFQNAGKGVCIELQNLCERYLAQFEIPITKNETNLEQITTDYLCNTNQISVRTANCCIANGLDTLYKIVLSFKDNGSFLKQKIRNVGQKTCEELDELSQKYIIQLEEEIKLNDIPEEEKLQRRQEEIKNLIETDFVNAADNNLVDANDILNYFTDNQKIILRDKYDKLITTYSVRTMNRLREISFEKFATHYLFQNDSELLRIELLGKKSLKEAVDLKNKIKNEISQLINLPEEDIFKLELIRQKGEIVQNDFVFDFYKKYNHLPMFWILEQTLRKDNTRSIQILIDAFPIFKNQQILPLENIAKKFVITRERVRQIRNDVFNKTFEITNENVEYKKDSDLIRYSELLQNKDDWSYLLEFVEETNLNQESIEVQECLKKEQCNLSVKFALQIIAYVFRDSFSLFGGFEISNRDRVWKNTFLIKKYFTNVFDFERFIDEFADYVSKNEIEHWLDIEEFVINSQCWLKFDFDKLDIIVSIVRDILLNELYLYSEDIDGKIKIPATKERNPLDIVYEILQQNGNPMHIEEIFVEFKRFFPEHKYTEASQLRPFLNRNEAISHRNRNSVWTLKEWEHIKTGTIRDAIVEFLLKNDLPQTTDDITEYILQHFPTTNIASVRASMSNDTKNRFVFFENNLFGLRSKQYPSEYKKIEQQERQRKSFEQRLTELEKFIVENEHFPFSTSQDKEEEALYRWWKRIIDGKNLVTENQRNEVIRVQQRFAEYEIDRSAYEWNLNYNKAKAFLLESRRLPFAKGNEKFLYDWLRRAKEDFQSYSLNEEQRKKYIELSKMF